MVILIADDDKLIRFTMKSMLNDILDSTVHYIEATNGLELIDLCKKHVPDIAFVDIKMPYMDGITAIEAAEEYSPHTEFVIISGYSDFEYAKRCISLHVTDYLLKPVEEEQLQNIISRLEEKLTHTHQQTNSRFQLYLLNAFNYFSIIDKNPDYEEFPLLPAESYYIFGLFLNSSKKYRDECQNFQNHLIKRIDEIGHSLLKSHCHYSIVYSTEGIPYCIFKASKTLENKILDAIQKIYTLSYNSRFNLNVLYFKRHSFYNLFDACEYWDKHNYLCMNNDSKTILSTDYLEYPTPLKKALYTIHTLLLAYQNTDELHYKENLNKLYCLEQTVSVSLNLKCITSYIYKLTDCVLDNTNYSSFCKDLSHMSLKMYTFFEKQEYDLTEQIKTYIQKNYMNDISISQIADNFNLTPNYLSSIFHQRTHCKLIEYITEVRITNAKRLLVKNNTASVKDITVMVGYTSSRHFSTLFQKFTGQTPSSYRKALLSKSASL